jgi:nickel-type superoxide dismutase maturation protease
MVASMRFLAGWSAVRVEGPSMAPTLRADDGLVVRRAVRCGVLQPGDVVVAERPDRPGLLVVKRAVRREGDGWWLLSDNGFVTSDSREFGAVPDGLVVARAVVRVRGARFARVRRLRAPEI